jgi:phospholipid/cholesterol/gamma-HCH transport system substrate-binding protein
MIKQAPSMARIAAMIAFTLSVLALLMFLWLAFGGTIPIKPQSYRVKAHFPEAATLAVEADVRMAGVNIGKVKKKALDKGAARTTVEIEIRHQYAPIPKDTKAILRQKTLLGETYVELAPGDKSTGMIQDGSTIPSAHVQPTVELDEIFSSFDPATRKAFQNWMSELATAIRGGRSQDLNDAFGNLAGFSADGATLFRTLDEQNQAVKRLIKNTGVVFGAINERQGALQSLIKNSNDTFEATASRDAALAETFRIFPTFLDESKATLARLERFSQNTHPLVNELKGPADNLGPTIRDLGDLSPDLEALFRDLPGLIKSSETGLPATTRILKGAEPLFEAAHVFLPELNPILSYLNFRQDTVAGFLTNATADLSGKGSGRRQQTQIGIVDGKSLQKFTKRPYWERGNSYLEPNALQRAIALGGIESFDCKAAGGEKPEPVDNPPPGQDKQPPCFVAPPSLYDGKQFTILQRGRAPKVDPPKGRQGRRPARDPHPNDPLH